MIRRISLILVTFVCVSISAEEKEFTSSDPQLTQELKERRARAFELMPDNSILILLPAKSKNRSNDVNWDYRQTNDLFYLSGMPLAETYLVLIKDGKKQSEYLFFKEGSPAHIQWLGILPSAKQVKADTGIEQVYGHTKFKPFLGAILNGHEFKTGKRTGEANQPKHYSFFEKLLDGKVNLLLSLGRNRNIEASKISEEAKLTQQIGKQYPELKVRNISNTLNKMREIKTPFEIAKIQRAIDITIEAQKKAMHRVQTAEYEYQVQALIDYTFKDKGACCTSFPSITASGENTTILHYKHPVARIQKDRLFLSDIGAEVDFYAADVTRTYPANGKFTDAQKEIYSAVLKAQKIGISKIKVGATITNISKAITASLGDDLLAMGLIDKNEKEQIFIYFAHGFGHSLGMDVHDAFTYHQKLKKNMIITVEPGIYVRKSKVESSEFYKKLGDEAKKKIDAALTKYDGMGVRIEDDILVTRKKAKVLSAAAPREIKDIELWMAKSQMKDQ